MRRPRRGGGARRSACLKAAGSDMPPAHAPGPVRDSRAFCFPLRETGKQNYGIHRCAHRFMKPPQAASDMIRVPYGQKDKLHGCGACLFGDPYGTPRLRVGRGAALTCHRHELHWTRTGLACICALRETAQIKVFVSVRTDSCTCHRHVRT